MHVIGVETFQLKANSCYNGKLCLTTNTSPFTEHTTT